MQKTVREATGVKITNPGFFAYSLFRNARINKQEPAVPVPRGTDKTRETR